MCLKLWSYSELYVTVLSVNKSGCFYHVVRSRISVCLFCLLETTSVNEFMKSFPKSEYWHFKISWNHCQENFQFSRRDFFGLQDFDISTRSYLTSCGDPWRGFGHLDFGISLDLTWNLVEILGEVLAAEILRSRRESRRVFGCRDFKISPRSRRESWWDFEISQRSRRESRRVFGHRDLGEILFKILQGKSS